MGSRPEDSYSSQGDTPLYTPRVYFKQINVWYDTCLTIYSQVYIFQYLIWNCCGSKWQINGKLEGDFLNVPQLFVINIPFFNSVKSQFYMYPCCVYVEY